VVSFAQTAPTGNLATAEAAFRPTDILFMGNVHIFATILDLVRKGYLKIHKGEDNNEKPEDVDYVISRVREADDSLLSHERFFINLLINEIGNGHSVSTREIQSFSKHNGSRFINLFSEWRNKIKQDAVSKGYYDKSKTKIGAILILAFIALLILNIFALAYGIFFGIAGTVIAVILFVYGVALLNWRSDYGYQQYKKWKKFKKYMKSYKVDLSNKDIKDYSSDISLIYALSLGMDKKIDNFNFDETTYVNKAYSYNGWLFWYLLLTNNDNNSFQKSMNKSFGGSNASYSGSGSFSSGGGGGAGGGGAGGF